MATSKHRIVVVGAGAAGHSAVSTLRREGYAGPLTVVHGEPHLPYNRTLVNKAVLPGLLTPEQAALPPLTALDVELVHGTATALDPRLTELVLDNGDRLRYSALIVATGSRPRSLRLETGVGGEDGQRLVHMHTIEDAARIRELLGVDPARARVTLLGAGFIGAETASYLVDLGAEVHLVSQPALPLAPVFGKEIGRRIAELHRDHLKAHFGRDVVELRADADSVTVSLDDDTRLESDLAVVAYGTVPAAGWLLGSVDGIAVDDWLRVRDLRGVYAAGGVAIHSASTGQRYRVDHWDAATAQGAQVARTLMHDIVGAPDPGPYAATTGFTLSVYRHSLAAYGLPLPGAVERQQPPSNAEGILTTFHDPRTGSPTAAAALGAGRDLMALRGQLQRP